MISSVVVVAIFSSGAAAATFCSHSATVLMALFGASVVATFSSGAIALVVALLTVGGCPPDLAGLLTLLYFPD